MAVRIGSDSSPSSRGRELDYGRPSGAATTRRGFPVLNTITLADDADLAHLVDLIDMLPHPDETSFWGEGSGSIGRKIGHRLRVVLEGRAYPKDVDYLAVYILGAVVEVRVAGHVVERAGQLAL